MKVGHDISYQPERSLKLMAHIVARMIASRQADEHKAAEETLPLPVPFRRPAIPCAKPWHPDLRPDA